MFPLVFSAMGEEFLSVGEALVVAGESWAFGDCPEGFAAETTAASSSAC